MHDPAATHGLSELASELDVASDRARESLLAGQDGEAVRWLFSLWQRFGGVLTFHQALTEWKDSKAELRRFESSGEAWSRLSARDELSHPWGIVARLVQRSKAEALEDPGKAVVLARAAVRVSKTLSEEPCLERSRICLQAAALGILGNTLRIKRAWGPAEEAILEAVGLVADLEGAAWARIEFGSYLASRYRQERRSRKVSSSADRRG